MKTRMKREVQIVEISITWANEKTLQMRDLPFFSKETQNRRSRDFIGVFDSK